MKESHQKQQIEAELKAIEDAAKLKFASQDAQRMGIQPITNQQVSKKNYRTSGDRGGSGPRPRDKSVDSSASEVREYVWSEEDERSQAIQAISEAPPVDAAPLWEIDENTGFGVWKAVEKPDPAPQVTSPAESEPTNTPSNSKIEKPFPEEQSAVPSSSPVPLISSGFIPTSLSASRYSKPGAPKIQISLLSRPSNPSAAPPAPSSSSPPSVPKLEGLQSTFAASTTLTSQFSGSLDSSSHSLPPATAESATAEPIIFRKRSRPASNALESSNTRIKTE